MPGFSASTQYFAPNQSPASAQDTWLSICSSLSSARLILWGRWREKTALPPSNVKNDFPERGVPLSPHTHRQSFIHFYV